MAHWNQTLYLMAGMIMPVFYLPQILHCIRDETGLKAFSMSKSLCQLLLRLAMVGFLVEVGNPMILFIALFDLFGRITEFSFALRALRRQAWAWCAIGQRLSPVTPVRNFLLRLRSVPRRSPLECANRGGLSE